MNVILRFVYQLSLGAWVGAIILVSFVVAPTVFRNLPRQEAGSVMSMVFGSYYSLCIGLGLVALVAVVLLALRGGWPRHLLVSAALVLVMLAAAGHVRYSIMPELMMVRSQVWAAEAADADGAEGVALRGRMDKLHDQSVQLNGAMLLIGIGLVFVAARREQQMEEANRAT
jgi:putative copper export protein